MAAMSATFEQWLEFVFNNPVRKREWYWDEDFDSRWAALELTDTLIVEYMTHLFLDPEVLKPYSLGQVEQGLWFLIGESSSGHSSEALLRHGVALPDRVACIHAMSNFFRNFVVAVTPGDYDAEKTSAVSDVQCASYMWWDIFPMRFYIRRCVRGEVTLLARLEKLNDGNLKTTTGAPKIEIEPEIHEATLKVMTEVLDLPSELCQMSALHGLGHWHDYHPERVEQIVDAFVARHNDLRPHLIEYASRARLGHVE
jgi:hypothetical protein